MTIKDINKIKTLLTELEYIDNLILSLEKNAEKILNEKANISMVVKIEYPTSKKVKVLDEDGSLCKEEDNNRWRNPFSLTSSLFGCLDEMHQKKEQFHTEINISELYTMEIFHLTLTHAKAERVKIIKKLEKIKTKL